MSRDEHPGSLGIERLLQLLLQLGGVGSGSGHGPPVTVQTEKFCSGGENEVPQIRGVFRS
eukprot:7318926-Prymnesium_polylepis.1